ncbi:hypothetical protein [Paractinoplanes durhamensis]|uniref:hypothetical protein n=1 Tax=Paractinoplanes durhamensis TaxID=113563 RepID=UPI0031D5B0C3
MSKNRDHVDELLHAAGERWRATQPAPPEPDPGRWPATTARTRARWIPIAAAAAVAAAVSAASVMLRPSGPDVPPAGVAEQGPPAAATPPAEPSIAEGVEAAIPIADQLLTDPTTGVYGIDTGTGHVQMVMLTPELYERLANAGAAQLLDLDPWLRPVA